jgi:integrase/recombinase XerD
MPAPLPFPEISEWPAADRRLPRYLSQDEVRQFFVVIHRPRDQALFALMYFYGLRVGEVCLLRRGDVDLVRKRIVIKRLKNGVWTERPLFSRAAELLRAYLNPAHPVGAPLFPGMAGPLRKRQIQSLFARYRAAAGISAFHRCHSLRHSIATHLLDAGLPLEFVQDHLGHRDIRSTSIYARISGRHREEVFQRLEASPWIVQPGQPVTPTAKEDSV